MQWIEIAEKNMKLKNTTTKQQADVLIIITASA